MSSLYNRLASTRRVSVSSTRPSASRRSFFMAVS
jgi:hypothetical protein